MVREHPLLLDLFCGAGGAGEGYRRAGFDILGVDVSEEPNYPGPSVRADALEFLATADLSRFDVVHASPPCQRFTAYRRRGAGVGESYPDLIAPVREALMATGKPWVIENVPGAPLRYPVQLCGSSFGLDVRRHRLFECSEPLMVPMCEHGSQLPRFPCATNRSNLRCTVEIGVWRIPLAVQQAAMGIDWMTLPELSQAVPPAYTQHVGDALLQAVSRERAA